jgi:Zn-finger domain-containing protein
LEVNAEKTKYTIMPPGQNTGKNNIKVSNKSLDAMEQFKRLGKTLTNQNSFHEEIKSRECLLSFGAETFVFQFSI